MLLKKETTNDLLTFGYNGLEEYFQNAFMTASYQQGITKSVIIYSNTFADYMTSSHNNYNAMPRQKKFQIFSQSK